jgi:F0F1-type ATP synthase assembly protein I
MAPRPSDPKELSRLMAYSQVGLEMVAPIGVGLGLDFWLGWLPWCTVVGAALGLTLGLFHLVHLMNREIAAEAAKRKRESS